MKQKGHWELSAAGEVLFFILGVIVCLVIVPFLTEGAPNETKIQKSLYGNGVENSLLERRVEYPEYVSPGIPQPNLSKLIQEAGRSLEQYEDMLAMEKLRRSFPYADETKLRRLYELDKADRTLKKQGEKKGARP